MTSLVAGDTILTAANGAPAATRVVVNVHRAAHSGRGAAASHGVVLKLHHEGGLLSVTPDHVIFADGSFRPAREVRVGSVLHDPAHSELAVDKIERAWERIINPLTLTGTLLVSEGGGVPVLVSTYPDWLAPAVLQLPTYPLIFTGLLTRSVRHARGHAARL